MPLSKHLSMSISEHLQHVGKMLFQIIGRIVVGIGARRVYVSALPFIRWMIAVLRRRLGFGARGFAQRSLLVLLSLFLFALGAGRPRSLGSISSVIWLECHAILAG
jgi:hypothetical protein